MKTLLLAAVVAAAPAAEPAKPEQCQLVIRYMSDNPETVQIEHPKTFLCGRIVLEQTALEAALHLAKGYQKN
jgi:hypothetical protein